MQNGKFAPIYLLYGDEPFFIDKDELAAKALSIMNNKKITSLIVNKSKETKSTIGVIHIHTILQSNIT